MILSCADRETEKIIRRVPSRKYRSIQDRAEEKLAVLNAASSLLDLKLPSLRLEKLSGDRRGQYSIRINDQFRICFVWDGKNASSVEIVDYH